MLSVSPSPATRGSGFYFAFFGGLAAWFPFLGVYFRTLGLSGWQIGLLSAFLPAATFLLAAPLTALADRRGSHLRMLAVGSVGLGGSLLLFTLSGRFWVLVLFMAVTAAFYSALTPLADTVVAGMAVRHRLNYGGMRLWGSIGFAVAAIAGGALWARSGYRVMFLVSALIYGGVAWAVRGLDRTAFVEHHNRVPLRSLLHDRFLIVLLLATFIVSAAVGMDMAFSGVYMSHLGGGGLYVGLIFGFSAAFELPTMRYSARLSGWIGGPACLLTAYGLFGVAYLGYALSTAPIVMLAFSIFRGLAFGLYYASTVRLLSERAPVEWAGALQGIMNGLAFGLAQLLSRPLAGIVYDTLGPPMVFFSGAGIIAVGMVLMASVVVGRSAERTPASVGG